MVLAHRGRIAIFGHRIAALLDRRIIREGFGTMDRCAAGRTNPLCTAARGDAGAGLVQHLPPRAYRGRATPALRLRR